VRNVNIRFIRKLNASDYRLILSQEIQTFRKLLKKCPKCGSSEGFWLGVKLREAYLQCKHCGTIIEAAEMVPLEEEKKKEGRFRQLLRRISF